MPSDRKSTSFNRIQCSDKLALPKGCGHLDAGAFPTREEQHPYAHGRLSPVATGSGGPYGLEDSPASHRARKRATRAEYLYQERSALYSGGRACWKRQPLSHAGFKARQLLLSRISISLAAQSMGSMGALITASTNPSNHAAPRPKGARALGNCRSLPCSPNTFLLLLQMELGLSDNCHHESKGTLFRFHVSKQLRSIPITKVREPSGNTDRCHIHLTSFY